MRDFFCLSNFDAKDEIEIERTLERVVGKKEREREREKEGERGRESGGV